MLQQVSSLTSDSLRRAEAIVKYTGQTVESFHRLFNDLAKRRGRGTTTNEEQDLLRAMVVFAGAGLDATLKRVVKDALPLVLERSSSARDGFKKFAIRYLCRTDVENEETDDPQPSIRRIASLLTTNSPRQALVEQLVEERTDHSLQSLAELKRTVAVLGISHFPVGVVLEEAFKVRNDIVHEMDVDFAEAVGKRNRRQRSREKMTEYARALHGATVYLLSEVDKLLSQP